MERKIICSVLMCMVCLFISGCTKPDLGFTWSFEEGVKPTETPKPELEIVAGLESKDHISTQDNHEFVFREQQVTSKPGIGTKQKYTRNVLMYLDNGVYYPIQIPQTLECVTDNSKYVYAKDGSLSISVVSGLDIYDFSAAAFIENGEALKSNIIVSKVGVKGPQEAAIHIANDKTIIARCYNNPDLYETILDGFLNNVFYVSEYNCVTTNDLVTEVLDKLPLYTGFHMTVYAGLGDDLQKIYTFDDGTLTISRELRRFDDACEKLGTKLAVIANDNVARKVFKSDKIYYVEIGKYTLGVYSVNFNTCFTLFGEGDEARYNIIAFLEAQE